MWELLGAASAIQRLAADWELRDGGGNERRRGGRCKAKGSAEVRFPRIAIPEGAIIKWTHNRTRI